MAEAPTGTTEIEEIVNTEWIVPVIQQYAVDFTVAAPFLWWQDLRGKGSKVGAFSRMVLDTMTDTGEDTDLTTNAFETAGVQITAAEIGIRRDINDAAIEESIIGAQLFDLLVRDAGTLCAVSLDDDICALFAGFTNAVGTSGANLTIANMVEAQATIRIAGQRGKLVYILDDQQALDYQSAQAAATSTTINGLMQPSTDSENGFLGSFFNHPVYQTGLCDTANTGANVVGACFVRGDTNPLTAALAGVMTRDVRVEMERDAHARQTIFVATAKWGVGETLDSSGVEITTDA